METVETCMLASTQIDTKKDVVKEIVVSLVWVGLTISLKIEMSSGQEAWYIQI